MRAAMSEGDLSSWNVAGAYASRPGATHSLDFGLTYSRQDYAGGNPAALAAVADNSRNVGEVFAFDRWTVAPRLTVDYGGRYARYDYLQRGDLLSPRTSVSVEPVRGTRLVTSVAQRMVAPGAEEFLLDECSGTVAAAGADVRTAAWAGGSGEPARRARAYGRIRLSSTSSKTRRLSASSDSSSTSTISWSRSSVCTCRTGPDSAGHYFVASAGGVEADGWAFRLSNIVESAVSRARSTTASPARSGRELATSRRRGTPRPGRSPGVPRPRICTTSRPRSRPPFPRPRPAWWSSTRSTPATPGSIRRSPGPDSTPVQRPAQPGAAVRFRRHPLGDPGRRPESVPRSHRSGVGLRRAPRRPPAQARRRRLPRPLLRHRRRRPVVRLFGSRFQLVGSTPGVSHENSLSFRYLDRHTPRTFRGTALASPTPGPPSCQSFRSQRPANWAGALLRTRRNLRSSRRCSASGS